MLSEKAFPLHSVLMVTYNHEAYVAQAINSILGQDTDFELCVIDDASQDSTWEIVTQFAHNDDRIIATRNPKNVGALANIAAVKEAASGTIVSYCAGDDLLLPGALNAIESAVLTNDLVDEPFLIVSNTVHLYPNGTTSVFDNYAFRDQPIFEARLKYGLSYRGVGYSKALLSQVPAEASLPSELGLLADWIKGFYEVVIAQPIVFIPECTAVYRVHDGISAGRSPQETSQNYLAALRYIELNFPSHLDDRTRVYMAATQDLHSYVLNPSISTLMRATGGLIRLFGEAHPNYPWYQHAKLLLPDKARLLVRRLYRNLPPSATEDRKYSSS